MNKKKENKGSILSGIGGLFTIAGIVLMVLKGSAMGYLTVIIIGVFLAAYGFMLTAKAGKKEED